MRITVSCQFCFQNPTGSSREWVGPINRIGNIFVNKESQDKFTTYDETDSLVKFLRPSSPPPHPGLPPAPSTDQEEPMTLERNCLPLAE